MHCETCKCEIRDKEVFFRRLQEDLEAGGLDREIAEQKRKLREAVTLAGYDPDGEDGDRLVGALMLTYSMEWIQDERRPVRLVWVLAALLGLSPDHPPTVEDGVHDELWGSPLDVNEL